LFQPPLSQGLLWCKAYIYSKKILKKLEQIWARKYVSVLFFLRKIGHRMHPFGHRKFTNQKPKKKTSQIRPPCSPIRPPNLTASELQFWVTFTTMFMQFDHINLKSSLPYVFTNKYILYKSFRTIWAPCCHFSIYQTLYKIWIKFYAYVW